MYYEQLQEYAKMLRNLSAILDKAAAHADARKFDPNNYLSLRLAPDMFPLGKQVQVVCDGAKLFGARMSGQDAPKHDDTEKTLGELKQRIESTLGYIGTLRPEHFAKADDVKVSLPWMQGKYLEARDSMVQFSVPNFYFHMMACYAILRAAGVELGKMDFIGTLPLKGG